MELKDYIKSLLPLSDEKAILISSAFRLIEIKKNEFLFTENTLNKYSYYLEKGYVRSFVYDADGKEVTFNLFSSPRFVNDFLSFFKQEPTNENFQAITDCSLWVLDYDGVQELFHTVPEFREFGRMMLVSNYAMLNDRMISMIKDSAELRYLKLMNSFPDVFMNVPLKIIASFLGITDTSLSRIRKTSMQK